MIFRPQNGIKIASKMKRTQKQKNSQNWPPEAPPIGVDRRRSAGEAEGGVGGYRGVNFIIFYLIYRIHVMEIRPLRSPIPYAKAPDVNL